MTNAPLHRIIRLRELPDYVASAHQIDAMIIRDEFPKPIKLNDLGRAKGWLEHELIVWQHADLLGRLAGHTGEGGRSCR